MESSAAPLLDAKGPEDSSGPAVPDSATPFGTAGPGLGPAGVLFPGCRPAPGSFWSHLRAGKRRRTELREGSLKLERVPGAGFSSRFVLFAVPETKAVFLTREEKNLVTATKRAPK